MKVSAFLVVILFAEFAMADQLVQPKDSEEKHGTTAASAERDPMEATSGDNDDVNNHHRIPRERFDEWSKQNDQSGQSNNGSNVQA